VRELLQETRVGTMNYWGEETRISGSEQVYVSPCRQYQLSIWKHKTKPGCWDYSSGRIERILDRRPGELDKDYSFRSHFATIRRNYTSFPFAWAYLNGEALLFCADDYQSYGVVRCSDGMVAVCRNPGRGQGVGWCWAAIDWKSEEPMKLRVEGCYWAFPY